ncbi:MAG TPA: hypothetical protein VLQ45_25450 [Thermoanaerobaculia bacterium]|nr:hypothetical protein [Thermoanaerobaculia bacterium]
MATRVQVILNAEEKKIFQHQASREGLSLSSWLRRAGQEMLRQETRIMTKKDLDSFFAACDAREEGVEPEWEEHLAVLERSKRSGASET